MSDSRPVVKTPQRIQRKRTKGWRMPEGAVYVGRPTLWGNPFKVGDKAFRSDGYGFLWIIDRRRAVAFYRESLHGPSEYTVQGGVEVPAIGEIRRSLRGLDLACWCSLDQPCHADVLLEIANA